MPMDLTTLQLEKILDDLKSLEASKLNVTSFISANHTILVRRSDSQYDGVSYHIVGISSGHVTDENKERLSDPYKSYKTK